MDKYVQFLTLSIFVLIPEHSHGMDEPPKLLRGKKPSHYINSLINPESVPIDTTKNNNDPYLSGKKTPKSLNGKKPAQNLLVAGGSDLFTNCEIKEDKDGSSYTGKPLNELTFAQSAMMPKIDDHTGLIYFYNDRSPSQIELHPSIPPHNDETFKSNTHPESLETEEGFGSCHDEGAGEKNFRPAAKARETSQSFSITSDNKDEQENSHVAQSIENDSINESNIVKYPNFENQNSENFNEGPISKIKNKKEEGEVENPTIWPWFMNGMLKMKYGSGATYHYGSGIVISDYCVLTAAHNLLKIKGGNLLQPDEITFYVGVTKGRASSLNINNKTISGFKVVGMAINPTYKNLINKPDDDPSKWGADFGVIKLADPLGITTGSAGLKCLKKEGDNEIAIRINGYPSSLLSLNNQWNLLSERSLYTMKGIIKENQPDYVHHSVATSYGHSGSGILQFIEHDPAVEADIPDCYSIHTYGPHDKGSIGTLLTPEKIKLISAWVSYFESIK